MSSDDKARRERLSDEAQQALEERDDRITKAMTALGVKIDRITGSVIRFHDERGSRPFTTPVVKQSPASLTEVLQRPYTTPISVDESATIAALQRDVARMRGLRLMELLNEEWTIDRLDHGQREMLGRAMHKLSAHVDGAIAVAVDALMVDPSKARAILSDAPFKHIALAVAKERLAEIHGMEAKVAALPDEVPEACFACEVCKQEFKTSASRDYHTWDGACSYYAGADRSAFPTPLGRAPCTCEVPRDLGPERNGAIDGHEGPCLSRAAAFYEARP